MSATLNWSAKAWKDFPSSPNEENFLAALAKLNAQTKNLHTSTYLECIKVGQSRMNRATPNTPTDKAHRMFWWLVNMDAPTTVQDKSMQDSRRILEQTSPCYYDPIGRTQWYCHMLKLLDTHRYGHSNHVQDESMYMTALRPWLLPPLPRIPFPDLDKAPSWLKHYGDLMTNAPSFNACALLKEVAQLPIDNQFDIVHTMSKRDVSPAYTQMQVALLQQIATYFKTNIRTVYPKFDYGSVVSTLMQNPAVDKKTITSITMDLMAAWEMHQELPVYLKLTSQLYNINSPVHTLFRTLPRNEQFRHLANASAHILNPNKTPSQGMPSLLVTGTVAYIHELQPWPPVYIEQLQRIIPNSERGLAFAQALDPQAAIAETLCGADWHAHWRGLYTQKQSEVEMITLPMGLDDSNQ